MANSFRAGDRIRCINDGDLSGVPNSEVREYLKQGKTYEVEEMRLNGDVVVKGVMSTWDPSRFELAEASQLFQRDDLVRVKDSPLNKGGPLIPGDVYRFLEYAHSGDSQKYVNIDILKDGCSVRGPFFEERFELVSRPSSSSEEDVTERVRKDVERCLELVRAVYGSTAQARDSLAEIKHTLRGLSDLLREQ